MCGSLDSISSALGTDGSGGGALGFVSDALGTSGKKGVGLLQDPTSMAVVAAVAAYYGMPTEMVTGADVSSAAGAGVVSQEAAAPVLTSLGEGTAATATVGDTAAMAGVMGGTAASGAGAGVDMTALAAGGGGSAWTANQILGAGSLASGVLGMVGAGQGAAAGASAADPFASQRPQYQRQLSALMADPNKVMPNTPGYQAGLQATERADAAQGFAGGGRAATDIAAYSSDFYNKQVGILSGLAGATSGSPGTAGSIVAQGATNQQSALNTLMTGASLLWGK